MNQRVIGVFISAPSSLDEAAFLRRVALKICDRTLALGNQRGGFAGPTRRSVGSQWVAIGAVLLALGMLIVVSPEVPDRSQTGWAMAVAGGVLIVGAAVMRRGRTGLRRGRLRRRLRSLIPRSSSSEEKSVRASEELLARAIEHANECQRKLRFSRSESTETGGGLDFHGVGAKVARTVNLAEAPLTKDDVVEALSNVIEGLNGAGYRVVVAIDELDKMDVDNERTTLLFNAMKSLFAIRGCSFLVTISTSAWASFEQRGLKVGTVFDSSFDDIIEARPFSFVDARRLLHQRINLDADRRDGQIGVKRGQLSDTQILFANVAAGGIARDLLRNTRQLGEIEETRDVALSEVTAKFVEIEAMNKFEAAMLDMRSEADRSASEEYADRLEDLRRKWPQLSAANLLDMIRVRHTDYCQLLTLKQGNRARPDNELGMNSVDGQVRLADIELRVVSYLAFLRLLERAFGPTGPIQKLADARRCRFVDLPRDAMEAFERLQQAKEQVGLGGAARFALQDADTAIRDALVEGSSTG